jgi:hypothetical protein
LQPFHLEPVKYSDKTVDIQGGTKVSNISCNFLISQFMKKMFNIKVDWCIILHHLERVHKYSG